MNLKAKILVNSLVYLSRNKRNGGHQILLLAGIAKRVGEFGTESIHTFPETSDAL